MAREGAADWLRWPVVRWPPPAVCCLPPAARCPRPFPAEPVRVCRRATGIGHGPGGAPGSRTRCACLCLCVHTVAEAEKSCGSTPTPTPTGPPRWLAAAAAPGGTPASEDSVGTRPESVVKRRGSWLRGSWTALPTAPLPTPAAGLPPPTWDGRRETPLRGGETSEFMVGSLRCGECWLRNRSSSMVSVPRSRARQGFRRERG